MSWPLLLWLVLCDGQASLLTADDYFVREKASAMLLASYPISAPALCRVVATGELEARERARRILQSSGHGQSYLDQQLVKVQISLCRYGYCGWPWIDSLPSGYDDRGPIISKYLIESKKIVPDGLYGAPHWWEFRMATALYVRDLLRAGRTLEEISLLLQRMVDGDRMQWERSGQQWAWVGR